jgi:hypothetical protein
MRKIFFASILQVGMVFLANGQDKICIGIPPVRSTLPGMQAHTNPENTGNYYNPQSNLYNELNGSTDAFTDAITASFSRAKRFVLVDRTHLEAEDQEKELQKSEDYIDGKTIDQGKSLGAQYLILSTLTTYSNDGVVCKFNLSLNVIDVATSKIIANDVIEAKGGGHKGSGGLGSFLTALSAASHPQQPVYQQPVYQEHRPPSVDEKTDALRKALLSVNNQIAAFILKNFPETFAIAEIEERDKKGNILKVLISGGTDAGLLKGNRLKVIELQELEVEGKQMQRKKEIGELEIITVEDENFSVCKVISG